MQGGDRLLYELRFLAVEDRAPCAEYIARNSLDDKVHTSLDTPVVIHRICKKWGSVLACCAAAAAPPFPPPPPPPMSPAVFGCASCKGCVSPRPSHSRPAEVRRHASTRVRGVTKPLIRWAKPPCRRRDSWRVR